MNHWWVAPQFFRKGIGLIEIVSGVRPREPIIIKEMEAIGRVPFKAYPGSLQNCQMSTVAL